MVRIATQDGTHDDELPVVPNANIEQLANDRQLDYAERTPIDGVELSAVISTRLRRLPDRAVPGAYAKLSELIDDIEREEAMPKRSTIVTTEGNLRSFIRRTIAEVMTEAPGFRRKPKWDWSANRAKKPTPEELADLRKRLESFDDGSVEAPKEKKRAYTSSLEVGKSGGAELKDIAKELGFSVSGAKAALEKGIKKARYLFMTLDDEEREFLVLSAMNDYIELLVSSGELTDDDEAVLREHPAIVAELDGFREFLHKYVAKGMRDAGKDVDVEEEV